MKRRKVNLLETYDLTVLDNSYEVDSHLDIILLYKK